MAMPPPGMISPSPAAGVPAGPARGTPRLGVIAYEYPPLIGGMATYAQALVRYMHTRGYDVHVFTNERSETEPPGTVHPILTTDLARDLPGLARFDMDLWHAINFGYAPLAWLKRPFVLTVHGTDFLTPWVRWKMDRLPILWRAAPWMETSALRRALGVPVLRSVDQVLTCSRFSARLFRQEYPSARRAVVVPNGVDEWFSRTMDTEPPPARHPLRLLTVCNLDRANRRKNVDGCLRAMAMVGDRLNLQYWIIGDGNERPALVRLARQLGITDRVRFLGRVSRRELRDAYAAASLCVLVPRPRPGDVEGFGIVYLEAAAAGTPSLASRCSGATDAIADGCSGFFVDDPSPAGIAKALARFFTGQVPFDAQRIREHAARYAWPAVLKRVEGVYDRLLSRRPLRRADGPVQVPAAKPPALFRRRPSRDWHTWIRQAPPVVPGAPGGRVLLVSYMFPPTGGSAVQRPAKLAKYLPNLGWEVEVLTAAHHRFPWQDDSLCRDLAPDSLVHRAAGYEPACLAGRLCSILQHFVGKEARANAGTDARTRVVTDDRTSGTDALAAVTDDCTLGTDAHMAVTDDCASGTDARYPVTDDRGPGMDAGGLGTDALGLQSTGTHPGDRHGGRSLRWIEDRIYWRLARQTARMGMGSGESLWITSAVRTALHLHHRRPFDAVISTGPPHVAHRVAIRIARAAGLPWIADVRDPLRSDFDRTPPERRQAHAMLRLESAILNQASMVITTCPSLADDLRTRRPHRLEREVRWITNGFDREDLAAVAETITMAGKDRENCVFLAAGSFYGQREIARLIEPLQSVLDRRPEWAGCVRMIIAGTLDAEQQERWQYHRPEWLTLAGYVDHCSLLALAARAACTIVVVPDCRHGRLSIPGKTFELLALPTHLLALVPPGSDTERIVTAAGSATVVPFEDAANVASAMERIIAAHRAGRLAADRDWPAMDIYDRRVIAAQFAEALASVCGQASGLHERAQSCDTPESERPRGLKPAAHGCCGIAHGHRAEPQTGPGSFSAQTVEAAEVA